MRKWTAGSNPLFCWNRYLSVSISAALCRSNSDNAGYPWIKPDAVNRDLGRQISLRF